MVVSKNSQAKLWSGALEAIQAELEKATSKFPEWPTDPLHALAVLGEEYGELTKAILQHTYEPEKASKADIRTEALQTAAMAIRLLISLDLYKYQKSSMHNDTKEADDAS